MRQIGLLLVVLFTISFGSAAAQPSDDIIVVEWNMFSGGTGVRENILQQHLTDFDDVDLWALSEVRATNAPAYETAAEADESGDFREILGTTGNDDRLLIIYDDTRFDLIASEELMHIQITSGNRAPLIAEFHDTQTGENFKFVVVHLCRCAPPAPEARRHEQARLLNEWAADQTLPVIIAGDFNFDWDVANGEADHDLGYDNLTADDVFEWVRPAALATTQCELQGNGCEFNSVLDFVFVSGDAQNWGGTAEIMTADFPFPYASGNSDHRPVRATFTLDGQPPVEEEVTKADLLERIAALESELAALRTLVEQLPD
jgi:endonuclease/exonuclease/phosphatase family metal-dependent hydrolase